MLEGMGLGRQNRLLTSSEFSRVLNAPPNEVWRHQDRLFRILSTPSQQPRLGLAIAKRLMPRAVDRNRVRRLSRESFRAHLTELPHRDYVVFAREDLRQYEKKQIRHSLDGLMQAIIDHSERSH